MLLFILIPLILARIKKYKVVPAFRKVDLLPLYAVECIYVFAVAAAYFENYSFLRFASLIQMAFILVLLLPIIRRSLYKQALVGAASVLLGTALNRIVLNANGGKMPVLPSLSLHTGYYKPGSLSQGLDSLHILMTDSTKLNFLGDFIDTGFCVMSIGDVLIHLFVSIIVFYTVKSMQTSNKSE